MLEHERGGYTVIKTCTGYPVIDKAVYPAKYAALLLLEKLATDAIF